MLTLAACGRRPPLTPTSFWFVTTNTTYGQLVKTVGSPDRAYGSPRGGARVFTCEWDLINPTPADHYAMVLKFVGSPLKSNSLVQEIQLTNRPAFIDFSKKPIATKAPLRTGGCLITVSSSHA
jgi:hypothetical protein